MPDIKLIAFDLEGVLVDGCGSWTEVHKGLDTVKEADANAREYYDGKITFNEWAQRDVKLWEGIHIEKICKILNKIKLMKGASYAIPKLKRKYKLVIISGGLDILVNRIRDKLYMDYALANELIVKNNKVAGIKTTVDFYGKGYLLRKIANDFGMSPKECASVGDYLNDVPMFEASGFSVAFNPKHQAVVDSADEVVYGKDLRKILEFF